MTVTDTVTVPADGRRFAINMDTGERVCAACLHPKNRHCPTDGCLDGVGSKQECVCARYVAELHMCEHCGAVYAAKWQLQNHMMPEPTCLVMGRAAAGRHADPVKSSAPLAGVTAETVTARRLKRKRR
jgi:hypothetical protein